jgi:cyclase
MNIKQLFLFLLSLIIINQIYSQDSIKCPPKKITELGNNLYEITLQPCNIIASIGIDGVLLVDANYKEYRRFMLDEIKNLGGEKIKYIISTHWHYDHVGGNLVLGDDNTTIISSTYTKILLSSDQFLLGDSIKAHPEKLLPKITFDDKYNLKFNGEDIELIALPGGHTGGDIIVYFKKANVVHIGDIIFADEFPFIDCEHGGSVFEMAKNIQKIIDIMPKDVKIVPGHGETYSIEDLKRYKDMIVQTTEIVMSKKNEGKTLEEIKKANALKYFKKWANSFSKEDWIEYIYNSK